MKPDNETQNLHTGVFHVALCCPMSALRTILRGDYCSVCAGNQASGGACNGGCCPAAYECVTDTRVDSGEDDSHRCCAVAALPSITRPCHAKTLAFRYCRHSVQWFIIPSNALNMY